MRRFSALQLILLTLMACRISFAEDALNLHLVNRLTFGPTPALLQQVEQMGAERFIQQQLHPDTIPIPSDLASQLKQLATIAPSPKDIISEIREQRQAKNDGNTEQLRHPLQRLATEITHTDHLLRAVSSPRQLEEVLVDFWFNHFNVYGQKGLVRPFLASYEQEAIRPYVFGHFRDLLGATAHHPAMLFYLDNWQSTAAGFQPKRPKGPSGLNENYARELMELPRWVWTAATRKRM